jgi:hypothetical protein
MNSNLTARQILEVFLLEEIAAQPSDKKLLLYRALAVDTRDSALSTACNLMADELEMFARLERQMLLDFQRGALNAKPETRNPEL